MLIHRITLFAAACVNSGVLLLYPGDPQSTLQRPAPPAELVRTLWRSTEPVFTPQEQESLRTLEAMTRPAAESGLSTTRSQSVSLGAERAEELITDLYAQLDDQISYFMFVLTGWRSALDKHASVLDEIRIEIALGADDPGHARLRGCFYSYSRILAEYAYLSGQWSAGLMAWDEMTLEARDRFERIAGYLPDERIQHWVGLFQVVLEDSLSARADVDAQLQDLQSGLVEVCGLLEERRDALGLTGAEWDIQRLKNS